MTPLQQPIDEDTFADHDIEWRDDIGLYRGPITRVELIPSHDSITFAIEWRAVRDEAMHKWMSVPDTTPETLTLRLSTIEWYTRGDGHPIIFNVREPAIMTITGTLYPASFSRLPSVEVSSVVHDPMAIAH